MVAAVVVSWQQLRHERMILFLDDKSFFQVATVPGANRKVLGSHGTAAGILLFGTPGIRSSPGRCLEQE